MSGARLHVKVSAGAARDAITGWRGAALKLSVSAAPERGKANAAVIGLLADVLELPRTALQLQHGATSADKQIAVEGLTEAELRQRIDRHLAR